MAEKLKPCPFCGEREELCLLPDKHFYSVNCKVCGTLGPIGETEDIAIELWNRREGVKAQSRPLAYVPEMYELLKVWTQVRAEPMLMNARDTARKLLARIDGEEAEHEQHN